MTTAEFFMIDDFRPDELFTPIAVDAVEFLLPVAVLEDEEEDGSFALALA